MLLLQKFIVNIIILKARDIDLRYKILKQLISIDVIIMRYVKSQGNLANQLIKGSILAYEGPMADLGGSMQF